MHLEEGLRLRQARSYLAAAQQLEEALAQGMLDDRRTLTALHTIGLCYDDMDQMHKAIPYLEQALEVAKEERQRFDICWTLGVCHYKLHDYEEGYHLLKLAAAMDAPANLKEIADEKAAECIMQAEAAGRPFEP
jgi:tetratricopeptide (TPR) repeat protein